MFDYPIVKERDSCHFYLILFVQKRGLPGLDQELWLNMYNICIKELSFKMFTFIIFSYVCICGSGYVHLYAGVWEGQRCQISPGVGTAHGCELPDRGVVSRKFCVHMLPSHQSSLFLLHIVSYAIHMLKQQQMYIYSEFIIPPNVRQRGKINSGIYLVLPGVLTDCL